MIKKSPVSAFELLKPSIEIVKDNVFVYFLFIAIPQLLIEYGTGYASNPEADILNPFLITSAILGFILVAPTTYILLVTSKTKKLTIISILKNSYRYFFRITGLTIITAFLIFCGLILFIIPGIIMIRRYFLAPYVLIDQNLSIKGAMRESASLSKNKTSAIYDILGMFVLFSIIGVLSTIGAIISVILIILYTPAPALRYIEMKKLYK